MKRLAHFEHAGMEATLSHIEGINAPYQIVCVGIPKFISRGFFHEAEARVYFALAVEMCTNMMIQTEGFYKVLDE